MVENKCIICGKIFTAKRSTKKYCSKDCENKNRRLKYKQAKKQNIDPLHRGMSKKICLICEQEFTPKTPAANARQCCYNCMPEGTQLTRSKFLNLIRIKKGGKCQRCGYDTYLGCLDFHHIDPNIKEIGLGDGNFTLKTAIKEANKCILLCSNCHRELHAKLWNINEITRKEDS